MAFRSVVWLALFVSARRLRLAGGGTFDDRTTRR